MASLREGVEIGEGRFLMVCAKPVDRAGMGNMINAVTILAWRRLRP